MKPDPKQNFMILHELKFFYRFHSAVVILMTKIAWLHWFIGSNFFCLFCFCLGPLLQKNKLRLQNYRDISDTCLTRHMPDVTHSCKNYGNEMEIQLSSVTKKVQWYSSFYSLVLCLSWTPKHSPKDCSFV